MKFYRLQSCLQQVDKKQMNGIKKIEDVFGNGALYKATLSVVHIDRNKRQACNPSVNTKETTAYNGLQQTIVSQNIEKKDEAVAAAAIIGTQQHRNGKQTDECESHPADVSTEIFNSTEAEESEEKREHHILTCIMQRAGMNKIPRNL